MVCADAKDSIFILEIENRKSFLDPSILMFNDSKKQDVTQK